MEPKRLNELVDAINKELNSLDGFLSRHGLTEREFEYCLKWIKGSTKLYEEISTLKQDIAKARFRAREFEKRYRWFREEIGEQRVHEILMEYVRGERN